MQTAIELTKIDNNRVAGIGIGIPLITDMNRIPLIIPIINDIVAIKSLISTLFIVFPSFYGSYEPLINVDKVDQCKGCHNNLKI